MTERALRAGVIGLGAMGSNHVRVYGELHGVELVAVADIDDERVGGATRGRTLRGYADYRRLLDEEQLDIMSIAVPTLAHLEVATDVIERGVAALVEKPLAATIEEGCRLRDVSAAAGVPLMAGHVERFNPAVVELKAQLRAGAISYPRRRRPPPWTYCPGPYTREPTPCNRARCFLFSRTS